MVHYTNIVNTTRVVVHIMDMVGGYQDKAIKLRFDDKCLYRAMWACGFELKPTGQYWEILVTSMRMFIKIHQIAINQYKKLKNEIIYISLTNYVIEDQYLDLATEVFL